MAALVAAALLGTAYSTGLSAPGATAWAIPFPARQRLRGFSGGRDANSADIAVPSIAERPAKSKPNGSLASMAYRLVTVVVAASLAVPRRRQSSASKRPVLRSLAGGAASLPVAAKAFKAFSDSTMGMMLRLSALNFCKIYMAMLVLRITIMWFPNINPYRQPFYSMIQLTDPYLNLFRGWMPPIFGIDLSVILSFVVIQAVIDTLTISPF